MRVVSLAVATAIGVAGISFAISGRADDKPIKIAVVADKTGPLEAYAKQMISGFSMGLEYATKGSNAVAGRKIEVIEKDSQTKPDVGRSVLGEAYTDDGADLAVGGTQSGVALAMLPVAQDAKKVFIVEPAVADSITGDKWNRYIFRTGRNSTQDAVSNALALGGAGVSIAVLTPDYAFGHDFVAAFKAALEPTGAKLVFEEYAPPTTTDFTAPLQRVLDALAKEQGKKILFVNWAGAASPLPAMAALNLDKLGITVGGGGNIFPVLKAYKAFPGMEGAAYYYYQIPKNAENDWLVAEHQKRFNSPPDFFDCGGMSAAIAVVTALEKTKGNTDTETLIKAMEGMDFATPKGKMEFRKEDHQALQSMFGFKLKIDPAVEWAIPELTKELTIADMKVPVGNIPK
jgi:branched-chain amino acid transport system substrate-binding protein